VYQIIQPLLEAGEKVAIMGDFNTLSRHDQAQHRDAGLADMLLRTDHTVTYAFMNCCLVDSCGPEWRTP
jgi:hypothetical protein